MKKAYWLLIAMVSFVWIVRCEAATFKDYTWDGSAGDGQWFTAVNWTAPGGGDGLPGDTQDPGSAILDRAYIGDVAGTITYGSSMPNVFDILYITKADAALLTVNINANVTMSHANVTDPDDWNERTTIGAGGNLVFNVNTGICQTTQGKVDINADVNVASNAEFRAIASSRSGGELRINGGVTTVHGWLGTMTPSDQTTMRKMPLNQYDSSICVDGGVLYPDLVKMIQGGASMVITNGGVLCTRRGAAGLELMNSFAANNSKDIMIELWDGSVTNVGALRIGGGFAYNHRNRSYILVREGSWQQKGATMLGDGREGYITVSGGTFETPSDCYVGGARIADGSPVPGVGVAYGGTLTITGGTVRVVNPDTTNSHEATSYIYNGKHWYRHADGALRDTYLGQRLAFTSLRAGGDGLELNRPYYTTDHTHGGFQATYAGLSTNLYLGNEEVSGTTAYTGAGSNMFHTLPARLLVGNRMLLSGDAWLMNTGTLNLVSGTLTVDELVATNGSASVLNVSGGTLNMSGADIDIDTMFVIGDGTTAAMLNLQGGTHTIDDGLTINTNATLAIGGTNAMGSATLDGDLTLHTDAILDIDFDAATNDWLVVSGTVTLPSQGTLHLHGLDASSRTLITIMQASSFVGSPTAWPRVMVNGIYYGIAIHGNQLVLQAPMGTVIIIR